jgi:hypothetical protein
LRVAGGLAVPALSAAGWAIVVLARLS